MTPGEKRSITSSMKKASEQFTKNPTAFATKEAFLQEFYDFWVDYSMKNKLSWCFDKKSGVKEYHLADDFKREMVEKIAEQFKDSLSQIVEKVQTISSLSNVENKLRPLRSKKKRIRAKRQKRQAM